MLLIDCPYCGMARPEIEFAYGGEAHIARPPDASVLSDAEWADFLYFRSNPKGVLAERWRHTHGCGRFFNCLRDTLSDRILTTYKAGEPRPGWAKRTRRAARMSQPFRLAGVGSIDRSRPLVFTFDGLDYQGYSGDTLASALIANGLHLVGRSFKYHRPRGILSAGAEEPNALVTLARGPGRVTPNLRATQIELYDGLRATSQNRWPSLKFDLGSVNDLFSPLFGAGFYYKTFMGPSWAWRHIYEPMIRRAAGLGRPPREPDPDRYQRIFDHCDVLVVGAGPAGLAAALSASESGARVVVCDENPAPGGSLLAETEAEIEGKERTRLACETRSLRCAPRPTCGSCRARRRSAITRRISSGSASASRNPTSPPIPTCRANAYGRCARARWCWRPARSSVRWSFRTTTAPL